MASIGLARSGLEAEQGTVVFRSTARQVFENGIAASTEIVPIPETASEPIARPRQGPESREARQQACDVGTVGGLGKYKIHAGV